ncbi:phenoloxidase-activating factor 1-like [Photinus pyralis]|uniref:phenoloxidase-activating factor 1-like n=1 Tax=Photinus pyralis TaxID=7054 RepID=UPI0012675B13|nr:phenoloxidase-activating factor 1-like [Photinus pyralis]
MCFFCSVTRAMQWVVAILLLLGLLENLPARSQHTDDKACDGRGSFEEFPWTAQLLYDEDKSIKCTGSLINSRYILTVAHCLKTRGTKLTGVRLGHTNHARYGTVQEFSAERVIPHPKFIRFSAANDIGLIRLSKPAQYSRHISPIYLPLSKNAPLADGAQVASSGWGVLGYGEVQTEVKKKILSTLVSNEICKKLYTNSTKPVTSNHLCATEGDTHACLGDSGAPLMYRRDNRWEQIGVLSFGLWCGSEYPTVYTNVAKYLDWIKQNSGLNKKK